MYTLILIFFSHPKLIWFHDFFSFFRYSALLFIFTISYTDQSQDVDRLYPALDIRQYLADSLKNFTKIAQNPSSNNNIGPKFIWANGDEDDDLEDIFTMSSNESSPAPEDILTDTDSLYCDALSRKASIVRFLSARKALRALFNSAFLLCEWVQSECDLTKFMLLLLPHCSHAK